MKNEYVYVVFRYPFGARYSIEFVKIFSDYMDAWEFANIEQRKKNPMYYYYFAKRKIH